MTYKFKLKGHLDTKWCSWLSAKDISNEQNGVSCFFSEVEDQSALFGLLRRVRDIGLPLLSINICNEKEEQNEL